MSRRAGKKYGKEMADGSFLPNYGSFFKMKKLIKWALANILHYIGIFNLYRLYREKFNKNNNLIILRFHRILNGNKDITGISISKDKFDKTINFLKSNFNIISLEEAVKAIKEKRRFRKLTLVITFDDGYKDNYTYAYPILKKHNVPAAIFLTVNSIGKENDFWWDKVEIQNNVLSKDDISLLDWQEVEEMNNGLVSFGSHTLTHPFLSRLSRDKLEEEIKKSKGLLKQHLSKNIRFFSYPHGDFNEEIKEKVKKSGYEAAFSSKDTRDTNDLWALGRKGLNEEIVSGSLGRFSKPLLMFALLKNMR